MYTRLRELRCPYIRREAEGAAAAMGVTTVIKDYGTDILNAIREGDLQRLKQIVEKNLKLVSDSDSSADSETREWGKVGVEQGDPGNQPFGIHWVPPPPGSSGQKIALKDPCFGFG